MDPRFREDDGPGESGDDVVMSSFSGDRGDDSGRQNMDPRFREDDGPG